MFCEWKKADKKGETDKCCIDNSSGLLSFGLTVTLEDTTRRLTLLLKCLRTLCCVSTRTR